MAAGLTPVFTGNNVDIHINGSLFAFVETLTITRSANRRPVFVVGQPTFVDAPVTQATVTVQATNLVPIAPNNQLAGGNVPTGSLLNEVNASSYDITVHQGSNSSTPGAILYHVTNAFYNQDSVQVPGTDVLAYNLSWTAQDTQAWTTA